MSKSGTTGTAMNGDDPLKRMVKGSIPFGKFRRRADRKTPADNAYLGRKTCQANRDRKMKNAVTLPAVPWDEPEA